MHTLHFIKVVSFLSSARQIKELRHIFEVLPPVKRALHTCEFVRKTTLLSERNFY